ncbi:MFS transporter [Sinomonas sp. P10A9]|uniref:MFS transporter n=1 Tax=Sinomonas puerhi TaxID=3238584 RepID=A0AB39L5B6_9MICC
MSTAMTQPRTVSKSAHAQLVRAAAIGNFIEFFDFTLYGFFAVVISKQFFPAIDHTAALLSTFAIYGGAFVMRPVGAIVFGHVGDRIGRKTAMMVSVVLMTVATAAIGLLPTYAVIGVFAPLLLGICRLVQAVSAGGEQTGSYILVMEQSPVHERGRHGIKLLTYIMFGVGGGALVALGVTSLTTPAQLHDWGWRLPFLFVAPLGLVGLYMRLRLQDSEAFRAASQELARLERKPIPLFQAFRTAKKQMAVLFCWASLIALAGYILIGFMTTYMIEFQHFSISESLVVFGVGLMAAIPVVNQIGKWSDRVPRKTFALVMTLALLLWIFPAFILTQYGVFTAIIAIAVFAVILYPMNLVAGFAIIELFPVDIRASASGLPFQIGFAVFGGSAPFIATWLASSYSAIAPAYYVAGFAILILLVALRGLPTARAMETISVSVPEPPERAVVSAAEAPERP